MAYIISEDARELLKDVREFCKNEVREQARLSSTAIMLMSLQKLSGMNVSESAAYSVFIKIWLSCMSRMLEAICFQIAITEFDGVIASIFSLFSSSKVTSIFCWASEKFVP